VKGRCNFLVHGTLRLYSEPLQPVALSSGLLPGSATVPLPGSPSEGATAPLTIPAVHERRRKLVKRERSLRAPLPEAATSSAVLAPSPKASSSVPGSSSETRAAGAEVKLEAKAEN
jgi:hypothetical protein